MEVTAVEATGWRRPAEAGGGRRMGTRGPCCHTGFAEIRPEVGLDDQGEAIMTALPLPPHQQPSERTGPLPSPLSEQKLAVGQPLPTGYYISVRKSGD